MPRTENSFEQEGPRNTIERDYPRFLPSAGSGKRVMPTSGDDAWTILACMRFSTSLRRQSMPLETSSQSKSSFSAA